MLENTITDDEILYRRVRSNYGLYETQPNGRVLFNSQAFADPARRPSVDRAKLCKDGPKHTLGSYTDAGITSLITGDVRSINNLEQQDRNEIRTFEVDVEYKPTINDPILPENIAHAEICTNPPCTKGIFRRLREQLALLANARQWEIEPPDS